MLFSVESWDFRDVCVFGVPYKPVLGFRALLILKHRGRVQTQKSMMLIFERGYKLDGSMKPVQLLTR
jgi:hypothetical protein